MKGSKSFFSITLSIIMFAVINHSASADQKSTKQNYSYNYYTMNDECNEVYDPYEKLNRKIFAFNAVLDHFLLKPIAYGYKKITNDYTKARVGSFIENISVPLTTVNYGLQLNFDDSVRSMWRFLINSTFGIVGIFDVASKIGLKSKQQTFGSTLAHYGVAPGPYLIIPFFGPTNARDAGDGLFTNTALNPLKYKLHQDFKLSLTGTKLVHDRTMILPFTDYIEKNSTDSYVSVRSSIHQNRESSVQYPDDFECPKIPNLE